MAGLIKMMLYKNESILFSTVKPCEPFYGGISVKVDWSNYATKAYLKNATGTDASGLAAKSNLISLKAEVDKIDIGKLKTIPDHISKLSNIVNNIDTNGFVFKCMIQVNQN